MDWSCPRVSSRRLLAAKVSTVAAVAVLLLAGTNLHALLHQWQTADVTPQADHHPEPIHLDHGSIDVPCPACLGLHGQGRPVENPGPITRPEDPGQLAIAAPSAGVADLSYRLPLSRAPPLS